MKTPLLFLSFTLLSFLSFGQKLATGIVFHDSNRNKIRDKGELPLAGVAVSNGKEVVLTDKAGKWFLPVGDDTGFFVVKPSGYMTPVDYSMIPQHYYLHKPKGSPDLQVNGLLPTGPLPKSIDFPLWKQIEEKKFKALVFGDTQARGITEVN